MIKKVIAIIFSVLAFIFLIPYVLMLLWNGILPKVIHVETISYWQAVGIFIISKILFGGLKMKGCGGEKQKITQKLQDKWMNMTPEEKEIFKQKWKEYCKK